MILSYIRTALRNLWRRKGYALASTVGLAVGIGCCVLILIYVRSELGVNHIFDNVADIYRVDSEWRDPTMGLPMTTLAPVGGTLVREYPEVVDQVRIYLMTNTIRVDNESYRESVMMADTSLFRMFDVPMLHGNGTTAIDRPGSVVVSERLAEQVFGTTNVLGRTIAIQTWNTGWQDFAVTGVMASMPYNSVTHFANEEYDLIIPPTPYGQYFDEGGWNSWESRYILQFVQLAPQSDAAKLQTKLDGFIEAFAPPDFHGNLRIWLNPLRTLYLTDFGNRGWRVIWMLIVVGCLILFIACINFTNLATAQSFSRANEIGVRKALGAQRAQLTGQFLGESLMASLIASLVGVLLAAVFLHPFLRLLGKDMVDYSPWDGTSVALILGIAFLTGLLAGTYPAFILSSFRPSGALKGLETYRPSVLWLRRVLVMTQFAAAIVLIISVYTVSRQLSFITGMDLGFDKENVLVIQSVPRQWDQDGLAHAESARSRLLDAIPEVRSASLSWGTATDGAGNTRWMLPLGRNRDQALSMAYYLVDGAFRETYGIELKAGRFHSIDGSGTSGIVINEKAAAAFGWTPDEAVGQLIVVGFAPDADEEPPTPVAIIGVVADHHFESLHQPIRPLVYFSVADEPMYRVLSLRLASNDLPKTVDAIRSVFLEAFPEAPFDYYFLDDNIDGQYRAEQQIRSLVGVAAALALIVSCLGILGLASLTVGQRTKEIGLRKVLGATVPNIVGLLSKDVVWLLVAAFAVAGPAAYLVMTRWLQAFAYHVDLAWATFAAAGLGVLIVAWLTVSYHSIRAALSDPVQSLRYE